MTSPEFQSAQSGASTASFSAAARVRAAWKAGNPPDLASILAQPGISDVEASEAIVSDAEERWDRGLAGSLEHYQSTCPAWAERPRIRRAILLCEASRRVEGADDPPSPAAAAGSGLSAPPGGESPAQIRADFLARFPHLASEIDGVSQMLDLVAQALAQDSGANELAEGSTISKYVLVEALGAGSFGRVWRAWDRTLERYVALKVLFAPADEADLDRFLSEARAAASLDHPNIVAVHDAGLFDQIDRCFIDSQLAGDPAPSEDDAKAVRVAEPLEAVVSREGPFAPIRAARAAAAIAHAIAAAHARGILHRDLKPANILITSSGRPLVADFGLSVSGVPAQSTGPTRLVGTPAYMAPEQAARGPVTPLSDVYSIGAVLRFMLSGKHPYEPRAGSPDSRADVLDQAARAELRPIRSIRPDLPRTLAAIADRAVAANAADRYTSADQFAADLDSWLAHRPTIARPPAAPGAALLWGRRNAAAAIVSIAALLAIGIGTAVFVVNLRGERDRARDAETATKVALADAIAARDATEGAISFIESTLSVAQPGRLGRGATVIAALSEAAKNADSLKDRPLVDAAARTTLGSTYLRIGMANEAMPHLQRALEIRREKLGSANVDTLTTWRLYASGLWNIGKRPEAIAEMKLVADACEKGIGPDHRETLLALNTLGSQKLQMGDLAEAEALQTRVLEARQRTLGDDHTETIGARRSLAQVFAAQKKYDQAIALQREALDAISARYGPDSFFALVTVQDLAGTLRDAKRLDEAEPLLIRAADGLTSQLTADHPNSINARHNYGLFLLRDRRRADLALPVLQGAADAALRVGQPRSQVAINCRTTLGDCLRALGRLDEAESLLLTTLDDANAAFGPNSADSRRIAEVLSRVYDDRADPERAKKYRELASPKPSAVSAPGS